jgi:hypothetical protein
LGRCLRGLFLSHSCEMFIGRDMDADVGRKDGVDACMLATCKSRQRVESRIVMSYNIHYTYINK